MNAVIFDFDGVLTTQTLDIAVKELGKILGKPIDKERIALLEGTPIEGIISEYIGKPIDDPEVIEIDRKKLEMFRKDRKTIKLQEKPIELVKKLNKKGIKLAIASGSRKENLNEILGKTKNMFKIILTSEDFNKNKPDPEPYLTAAKKLGVTPSECIVIENAPRGIESAKAAGMTCIAITTTLKATHLKKADIIVNDYDQLEKTIFELIEAKK
ncbi:HAD family phosphatase [archaeon]|nr:HAD family phosphatase [archaeon]